MKRSVPWPVPLARTFLVLSLTGCMVGPDYKRPDAPVPVTYKELAGWKQATPLDGIDRGAWWSIYNDPELDQLERQVVISNQNVKSFEAAYRAGAGTYGPDTDFLVKQILEHEPVFFVF